MSDKDNDNIDQMEKRLATTSRKRYYAIIIGLIFLGALMTYYNYWYLKPASQHEVITTLNELKTNVSLNAKEISKNTEEINQTKQAVNGVAMTVNDTVIPNQITVAKGVREGLNIVIGKVNGVKNDTQLIDDIKFALDKVIADSKPVNFTNLNLTNDT